MARYTDLMELKNDTQRANAIRDRVTDVIEKALKAEFGDEFAFKLKKDVFITPNAIRIPKMTVVADVADITDKDGFSTGACIEANIKVKKWNTVEKRTGGITYAICLDDYKED